MDHPAVQLGVLYVFDVPEKLRYTDNIIPESIYTIAKEGEASVREPELKGSK